MWHLKSGIFFGGKDLSTTYNDVWLYNIQAAMWINGDYGMTTGTPPPAMAKSCAMSFGQTTYIFGGRSATGSQSNIVSQLQSAIFTFLYAAPPPQNIRNSRPPASLSCIHMFPRSWKCMYTQCFQYLGKLCIWNEALLITLPAIYLPGAIGCFLYFLTILVFFLWFVGFY